MKMLLSIVLLLAFAGWSQAFHRLGGNHGCTGAEAPTCQGKTASCTGTQTTACKGVVTSCTGMGIVTVPRKTVIRTSTDCHGNIVQTVRTRGVRYVAVQSVPTPPQPTLEAIPAPKKK